MNYGNIIVASGLDYSHVRWKCGIRRDLVPVERKSPLGDIYYDACPGWIEMLKVILASLLLLLGGCASLVDSATSRMASNINAAILDQNDPDTVRDGAPAYLLMIDGLIAGDPQSSELLLAGAKLYGSYSAAFTTDQARAARLAGKSLEYARRAICLEVAPVCAASGEPFDLFGASLERSGRSDIAPLYAYAVAWAGWIQVNSSDWNAVADLPRVTALFERCLVLDENYDHGGSHLYLGVIKSLRPAALGGQPEAARLHFERAIEISAGHNLMVKVLMARHYARNVFDRELHDSLLREVIDAPAEYPGFTLVNTLAQSEAGRLLAESDDFF